MKFRLIELVGWVLLGLGLLAFYESFVLLDRGRYLEGGPTTLIGFFIFRGGIQLIKVAVAARICTQVGARPEESKPAASPPTAARRPAAAAPPSRVL